MLPIALFVAAALLAATPGALAQDAPQDQPVEPVARPAVPERRPAIPRSEAPRPAPAPRVEVQPAEAPQPAQAEASGEQQRRAEPRTRARGDNPPVGTAVPRAQGRRDEPRRAPDPPRVAERGRPNVRSGGRTVYAPPVYNNYYYYPRRNYPYGYGAFGLGYFYYDPYQWYPNNYAYSGYGYPGYYPGQGYGGPGYDVFDIGQVRLRVTPRHAQVFVDGYFAGEVDDYDGIAQALKLESGPYRFEIVAPGYEPLEFDIRVIPGEKITYRGDLRRLP